MANPLDPYDRWGANPLSGYTPLYMGPVGTERVGGDAQLTMPSADVSPIVGWFGAHPRTAQMDADAARLTGNMLQFGPADVASVGALPLKAAAANLEQRISTRVPTAKGLPFDPHQTADLQIGPDSIAGTPVHDKVAAKLDSYPDVPTSNAGDSSGIIERSINHFKDNLRWIYDNMLPAVRDTAKNWYDGAHSMTRDLADQYGVAHRAVAAMTARLSPGTDWYQNLDMARRILDIHHTQGDAMATPEMGQLLQGYVDAQKLPKAAEAMQAALDNINSKPYGELDSDLERAMWIRAHDEAKTAADPTNGNYRVVHPDGYYLGTATTKGGQPQTLGWQSFDNIGRALKVMQDDSLPNISKQLGEAHKIRSFYNNIIAPDATAGDVTVDTHQIGASHLLPLGSSHDMVAVGMNGPPGHAATGSQGLYGIYAEATRRLADELGLLPRQVQSITWEGLRSLFPAEMKRSKKFIGSIDDLWSNSTDAAATRDAIGALRGVGDGRTIEAPDWFQPGP